MESKGITSLCGCLKIDSMDKKYFIADITDLRKYVPVTEAFTISELIPYFESVSLKYLRNNLGIGKKLFDSIFTEYNDGYDALSDIKKQLVHHLRSVISKFAMHHYIPFGVLNIGSDGITNVKKESKEAIKKWQKDDLEQKFLNEGFIALDILLDFLEENKVSFTVWTSSEAYTLTKSEFINSVAEFATYFPLVRSRRTFLALKPYIKQIGELEIYNILGSNLFDAIKAEIVSGTISAPNKIHLNAIRPAVANLVMNKALDQMAVIINENGVQVLSQGATTDNSQEARTISEVKLMRLKDDAGNTAMMFLNTLRKSLETGFTDQSGSRKNDLDSRSYYV